MSAVAGYGACNWSGGFYTGQDKQCRPAALLRGVSMSETNPFILGDEPGASPQLNGLLGMLRYARKMTLEAVVGLTPAQLDHRHDGESNSIGALLLHMAAAEAWYQAVTFDERPWNASEAARWQVAMNLGPEAALHIRGRPLEYYVAALTEVRARTEHELRHRDDGWLVITTPFFNGTANNFWKWFHVCEDEINHRGQIRWLRKRLPGAARPKIGAKNCASDED